MKNIDPKNLVKSVKDLVSDLEEELKEEVGNEAINQLNEVLESGEAIEFTDRVNQLFKEKGLKDEKGNLLQVERPTNIASRIIWEEDGQIAKFDLSVAEDRWFRANALYGNNILEKLGFKYTNI